MIEMGVVQGVPSTIPSRSSWRARPARSQDRPAVDCGSSPSPSNDAANLAARRLGRGVVTVVPVTSNLDRLYPFQVLLPAADTGLARDSKAQAEQVRSVAVERVGTRLGVVPQTTMHAIDEALRLHLGL